MTKELAEDYEILKEAANLLFLSKKDSQQRIFNSQLGDPYGVRTHKCMRERHVC